MKIRSLRVRLLLGAAFWMIAVVAAINIVVFAIVRYHNGWQDRRITHYAALSIVAVGFIIGGLFMVSRGLMPLRDLRRRLAAVREGRTQRIEGEYPLEVQPLVDDLNALLDDRERAVVRARKTAGDLAHGLKTPLAILGQESSPNVQQQVERMRRQIDYHLAHARATAATAPGLHCDVLPSVEGLVRTMLRLHASRGVAIDVRVAPEHTIRGRREDLDEMLGNLLDNACKWARSRVVVTSTADGATIIIHVDDDGPGLDPSLRETVLQRGVRADEAAPGSGLGLAIIRDLAELYGGTIALDASPMSGLRARLELPQAVRTEA
ncbi:MAG TPA: ATP-binding protein [Thermoanaerobaculia bacterium]|jgi:signal transduction histidine kinase